MNTYTFFARALTAVLLLALHVSARSQEVLTSACNQIHAGDSLNITKTEYFYAGDNGKDVVWDFGNLELTNSYFNKFNIIKDNQIIGYDSQKILKYHTTENGLALSGFENMMEYVDYHQEQVLLPLPLQYGQTYSKAYEGEGRYCGTHFIRTLGTMQITADAQGTLILSEADTLRHALRVHSVNTAAIRLSKDSCRNDSDNLKQIITERYQWYARGYRYPVLETFSSSTYHNANHIATQQSGYLCPPDIQAALNDSVNEQIRKYDALTQAGKSANAYKNKKDYSNSPCHHRTDCSFTYDLRTNGSLVTITYNLDSAAQIHVLVVDIMGMIYRDTEQNSPEGACQSMCIDCSGLRRGQYIIYINVNGTIYNNKIMIQ